MSARRVGGGCWQVRCLLSERRWATSCRAGPAGGRRLRALDGDRGGDRIVRRRGFLLAGVLAPFALASVTALAGGAILAMIADTLIPEAFEQAHLATGLIAVLGFLVAFVLSRLGGWRISY